MGIKIVLEKETLSISTAQFLQLLHNPSRFFTAILEIISVRTVGLLYLTVSIILFIQALSQQLLRENLDSVSAVQASQSLPFHIIYGLAIATTPLCYLFLWSIAKMFINWDVPKMKYETRSVLFIILCGELVYVLGLLISMPMRYITQNPDFSFSIGNMLILYGHNVKNGMLSWLLTKIDVFVIWEIIIIALGFGRLYNWHQSGLISRSYGLSVGIVYCIPIIFLILVQFVSSS